MTSLDDLWFLADESSQRAEQAYHRLQNRYSGYLEDTRTRRVSRRRFRTLAERVKDTGAPFGAHTIVYRDSGELLLVRHEGVDMWVVPGGEVSPDETFREAAERELTEEAGVRADYEGLAMATRIDLKCDDYSTWGILPIFAARAETVSTAVNDPDGEISRAEWFAELPSDTRDREELVAWREQALS